MAANMKKVVSYVRVSSEKQVGLGPSITAITAQIKYMQEYLETITREFIDEKEKKRR